MSNICGVNPIISTNIYTIVEQKIIKMHQAHTATQPLRESDRFFDFLRDRQVLMTLKKLKIVWVFYKVFNEE
jgi:hypothetical protein